MDPRDPKQSQFEGLSHDSLKLTKLRLQGEEANLKSESRHVRDHLSSLRSALAEIRFQLAQVEHFLSITNIIQMPAVPAEPEPQLVRTHGRWGKVTYERVEPPMRKPTPRRVPLAPRIKRFAVL